MKNREILFRGKRVDNGELVEGSLISHEYNGRNGELVEILTYITIGIGTYSIQVSPETVGQFTGLTDKNGVKVFEGDILLGMEEGNGETTAWEQVRYKIEFDSKRTAFVGVEIGVDNWDIEISDINTYYEVIGNIHDNPELLTK